MRYLSTRDKNIRITAAEAIAEGLSKDGGLFVPEVLPQLSKEQMLSLCEMTYPQRAAYIMTKFLTDFTFPEVASFCEKAYNTKTYSSPQIAPMHRLEKETWFLELWHGPTSAFKDMALQMLPHLLTASLAKTGEKREACILVATSGDTGKAALEGFCDVKQTKIMVFYPKDGVSDIQKLQMVSQAGDNVFVCGVNGNFDDAQSGVKAIFSNREFARLLSERGYFLSSANSINWGRLLPQIVYYVSAYCDLVNAGGVAVGEEINFAVPTGNFGNILAGFYAKQMGLPVGKLICASNANNVLTDFIQTGTYNRNRPFHTTISPSMDILISSNLERLIYAMSDDVETANYMQQLTTKGEYTVSEKIKAEIERTFWAGDTDDTRTKEVISETFRGYDYLIDTHTAVASNVLADYRRQTGDMRCTVVVSTASPYKFADSVLESLGQVNIKAGAEQLEQLSEVSSTPIPTPLASLRNAEARFHEIVEKEDMPRAVYAFLQ